MAHPLRAAPEEGCRQIVAAAEGTGLTTVAATNRDILADLFYTGRFDFVVYQREGRRLMPILAIELDGREHRDDPAVQRRDRKKDQICREHGFELIRVENSYARRYNYIKSILINYFRKVS